MNRNPKKRGEYRLKALPAMALSGSNSLAMSTTVVEGKTETRGGLVTFGVDHTRIHKIINGTAVAVCFVIDVKEWDDFADAVELEESVKSNAADAEPAKKSMKQQIRAAIMSTGNYTNVKVVAVTQDLPQTLGGPDVITIEVEVRNRAKSKRTKSGRE